MVPFHKEPTGNIGQLWDQSVAPVFTIHGATNNTNMELAMQPFYSVVQKNEFELYKKNLSDKDTVSHENSLPDMGKVVFLYETRTDIENICRWEANRISDMTGRPKRINAEGIAAVFRWNKTTGYVSESPLSEMEWQRFFKIDPNAPCLVCWEVKSKRSICCNCTSVICRDCRDKLKGGGVTCPACTLRWRN